MNDRTRNELDHIQSLRLPELQALFREVLGEETRCPNRGYLLRRIGEALEAREEAEAEAAGVADADEAADAADAAAVAEQRAGVASGDEAAGEGGMADALAPAPVALRLSRLDVASLRARYVAVLGRETRSENRAYLVWRIRQAEKELALGDASATAGLAADRAAAVAHKVLPLRLPVATVEALDAVWRRQGLRSRVALFRRALALYLRSTGEEGAAAVVESGTSAG